ncbi:MAG: hypothetical protein H7644_11745 [Candidatus Heimdallarchaeota archaeon]|nr:hypothetical protein [Candidatus Heimdallarchaeota archaeon]MCK5144434.1 hypothetical protein [Candidatus Heimdallarchaeota archaeon]
MKMRTTEVQSLLRADKRISRNWVKIILYTILGVSIILLTVFLASFSASDSRVSFTIFTQEFQDPETFFTGIDTPIAEGFGKQFNERLPGWSIYTLIFACLGFLSYLSVTYVSGTMIFENKNWLTNLQKQGLVQHYSTFNDLMITTKAGKIVISKSNMRYKIKLPKIENYDLTKLGLVKLNQTLTGFCTKEELSSIIHIYLSKVN